MAVGKRNGVSQVKSLAPEKCVNNFESVIFKLNIQTNTFDTHCKIAFQWMSQKYNTEKTESV